MKYITIAYTDKLNKYPITTTDINFEDIDNAKYLQ